LLKNPGFDQQQKGKDLPDSWSASADKILWRERVYLSKDYEIVSRPGAYGLASQGVSLKPGHRYTVTLTLKGEGGALGGALIVHGKDKPTREMPILWNIQPTGEYETYVGTFIAPNPVARLLIYNVARKGTIVYDRVSLREGEPDEPIVGQLSMREIDRPIGEPAVGHHIDWASPLAGAAVKSCFTLRSYLSLHDVIDLAHRIDLDYDVIHTDITGDECVSDTARRTMKRLAAGEYEVYVVSSKISEALRKTIEKRVAAGAGLVVVEGFGQGGKFHADRPWKAVDDGHYLRSSVPWELMPEKILASAQTSAVGKGRAVRLMFPSTTGRVWGLLPSEVSMDAYKTRQFEYWEWWESLLARAIVWAAQREGETTLHSERADGDKLVVRADRAPAGARVRVVLRSGREIRFDGPLLRKSPQEFALPADGRLTLSLPADLPAGLVLADLMLLDSQGRVVTWTSMGMTTAQKARIKAIKTDRETYSSDATTKLAVTLSSPQQVKTTIQARLIDAFGRVVSETTQDVQLSGGESPLTLALPIRRPLCVHHRAMVRAVCDGREEDSGWVDVLVPGVGPRVAGEDFLATTWAPGMTHPVVLAEFGERTRQLGLNSEFGSSLYAMSERGLPCGGYIGAPSGAFRCDKPSPQGVRPHCLSNPKVVGDFTTWAKETAAKQQSHGMFAVGITDEAFLTSRHQRDEVCFCEHCQGRYRTWLQARYSTLAALNTQWGTSYASWDEVRGSRTEDVRGKPNFAPFVDFRTFMADVWVDGCKTITAAYHEVAPQTPVGHTNTFGADPFNGNDYWKLCTQVGFGWGQEYSEAIKAQGQKAIFELWRSFVETPEARKSRGNAGVFFNYGWIGYDHREAAAHYEPWWLALHGSRGVSYYATKSMKPATGTSWCLVYPNRCFTGYSTAVAEALRDLRAGVGKLLMEYQREEPKIGLLWSYPSMLVSWCESTTNEPEPSERPGSDSFATHYTSALNIRQHLDELQLDYNYLDPSQILGSDVLRRYPLLFLPFSVAVSKAVVDRLEAYVEGGGVLVGDLRCLRTDEHGTPFTSDDPLERLFGVRRDGGKVQYGPTKVRFNTVAQGIDVNGREVELFGREKLVAQGATALGAHATGEPAVLVRRSGKGLSVYLNFQMPAYDVVTRELVRQVVGRAGVARNVVVENPTGGPPPRCYERNSFARGVITLHGFIRDHRRCNDADMVRFAFPQPAHVYNVRARTYLGHVDQLTDALSPGRTALFACLPYRVTGLDLQAPGQVAAGSEVVLRLAVRGSDGPPGDHVVHVELVDPAGQAVRHYTQNVVASGGCCTLRIPLAINEARGQWSVRAWDVLTGTGAQMSLAVVDSQSQR
jgi:beta-galactosidase GanA